MHVLIIEGSLTGHHPVYLERIAEEYLASGNTVSIAVLSKDCRHSSILKLKKIYKAQVNVFELDDREWEAALKSTFGSAGREFKIRRIFGKIFRKISDVRVVDFVFLPFLDYCLYAFGIMGAPFGQTSWGGVCMRPSFHYHHFGVRAPKPAFASVKQRLFLRLLHDKNLHAVYTIDELLHRFVSERHPSLESRLQYVPDPADLTGVHSYESAREKLGIPARAILVLVYGSLDERKGIDRLISAAYNSETSDTIHLLLVGRKATSIETLLSGHEAQSLRLQGRLHRLDGFVDKDTEHMAFIASDVVWLGYRSHYGMSGVLVQAAMAGSRILATQDGLIGWYASQLGETVVDTADLEQLIDALNSLSRLGPKSARMDKSSHFSRHTWSTFLGVLKSPVSH